MLHNVHNVSQWSVMFPRRYLSAAFLVNAFSRWPRPETIFPWSLPEHNLQRFTGRVQQEIFFLCFLVVSTRILRDIFQSFMVASTITIFFWWRPPEKQKSIVLMYSSKWIYQNIGDANYRIRISKVLYYSLIFPNVQQCTTMYHSVS